MADPGMQALAVLSSSTTRGTQRCAYNQRHFELATGHIMNFRRLVYELVHDQRDKIAKHDIDDGAHTCHRPSHAQPGDSGLRNGAINHSRGTKLLNQA